MRHGLALLVVIAACGDPPPLSLKFDVTDGDVQSCTTATGTRAERCSDVTMLCDAYASIRIFAPSDPTAPFVSACQPLLTKNLCAIGGVDLPAPAMPVKEQTLEVDIAVYPKAALTGSDGSIDCPHDVTFGADGFPAPCADPEDPTCILPAVGGRAFYHPGDAETVVSLGCTDLAPLRDPTCVGQTTLAVTSSVNDFDTGVSVSPATADSLLVSIGEPTFDSGSMEYALKSADTRALGRTIVTPVPEWGGNVDLQLVSSACIEVFEDGAQTTAALSCTNAIGAKPLDLPGVRLAKPTLDKILGALHVNQFPIDGLVVGVVVDSLGNPKSGVTVVPFPMGPEIKYMSDDGSNFSAPTTSGRGIWVSSDAPYGTTFGPAGSMVSKEGFGGLVAGKVDIVVIQLDPS